MNIFVTDEDPVIAAQNLCDSHICKMCLESAQMLCSAHWVGWKAVLSPAQELKGKALKAWLLENIPDPNLVPPYSMTHVNHPCSVWVRQTEANYDWLVQHALAICAEYTVRYGKTIKTQAVIEWAQYNKPPRFETSQKELTPFAVAMPDEFRVKNDPVASYKNYYLGSKVRFAKWRHGPSPKWWKH